MKPKGEYGWVSTSRKKRETLSGFLLPKLPAPLGKKGNRK